MRRLPQLESMSCARVMSVALLVMLAACRREYSIDVTPWLHATGKIPPQGIAQLPGETTLTVSGKTILEGRSFWYVSFGDSAIVRDDGRGRLFIVRKSGDVVDLRARGCDGDAVVAAFEQVVECRKSTRVARFDAQGERIEAPSAPTQDVSSWLQIGP